MNRIMKYISIVGVLPLMSIASISLASSSGGNNKCMSQPNSPPGEDTSNCLFSQAYTGFQKQYTQTLAQLSGGNNKSSMENSNPNNSFYDATQQPKQQTPTVTSTSEPTNNITNKTNASSNSQSSIRWF